MTMAYAAEIDPDLAAIEATRRGDRSAFDQLVRRHGGWVKGVIYGVLGNGDRTEDVAQQVWQSAWGRIGDLRSVGQWRTWLYRLARNAAVDAGREQTRRRKLAKQAADNPSIRQMAAPDSQVIGDERHRAVMDAIGGLTAIYREPFVLRHLEGWSYQQIAETMDLPIATIETRLVRARQLLRATLTGKV